MVRLLLTAVFSVGHMVSPVRIALRDREVSHEVVRGCTMPVLLTIRGGDHVPGAKLDQTLTAGLHQSSSFGEVEGLPAFVEVPRGARPWAEVHGADVQV